MKRFGKELGGYRAFGYALDKTPLGPPEIESEAVVEHDEEALRTLEDHEL